VPLKTKKELQYTNKLNLLTNNKVIGVVIEIDSMELEGRLASGKEVILLDIRNAAEVERGMLPESQHLPMHLLPVRMSEFPKDKDIVLYCHSGARSHHACRYLMQQGFQNVINLRGGILDWAKNGLEIVAPSLKTAV
jgi:rhodanese-related sulfurtransferase